MVKSITYTELGHIHPKFKDALSPDYVESDIGLFPYLTATVLGYQIGEPEALKMIHFLSGFIIDSVESRTRRENMIDYI